MKTVKRIGRGFFAAVAFGFIAFASSALAANEISVTVAVDKSVKQKMNVYAVGFSVNGKGRGSLGYSTTKSGPAGARYSFGFKSLGKNISCGSAVLKNSSTVVLYMNNNRCMNKVFKK